MEDREYIQGLPPRRPLSQSPAEGATARRVKDWLEADCTRLSGAIRQPRDERTEEEARILKDLAADSRIDAVLLLNRYGQVRWARDSACDGWGFVEVEKADRGPGELLLSGCRRGRECEASPESLSRFPVQALNGHGIPPIKGRCCGFP